MNIRGLAHVTTIERIATNVNNSVQWYIRKQTYNIERTHEKGGGKGVGTQDVNEFKTITYTMSTEAIYQSNDDS